MATEDEGVAYGRIGKNHNIKIEFSNIIVAKINITIEHDKKSKIHKFN